MGRAHGASQAALPLGRGLIRRRERLRAGAETWSDEQYLQRGLTVARDDHYDFIKHRFSGGAFDYDYDSLRLLFTGPRRYHAYGEHETPNLAVGRRGGGPPVFIVFDYNTILTGRRTCPEGGDIYFRYEGTDFARACEILPQRLPSDLAAQVTRARVHAEIARGVAGATSTT